MLNKRAQNEKTLDDTNQRIKGAIEYSVNSLKAELIQNETYPDFFENLPQPRQEVKYEHAV